MAPRPALVMMITMAVVFTAQATDLELTTDFFVSVGTNKANLTGDYFTSMDFRCEPQIPEGARVAVKKITSDTFPVLTGLGLSSAQIKYLPGGINPPHTHPRGTELLLVQKGTLTVGLVDTTNKFYTQVLRKGDVFVFPKGLVHYQINLGHKPVIAYVAFSSSNPGTVSLPATLFGSGIPDNVHMTAFKVDGGVVDSLQRPFGK
nr:germin-like protein [Physcomitrium patens]BAD86510.1 germin-like protein [Physcomitrium patens]